ncbi:MAG: glycerate kinase [Acidobacteria bacterium]|nr:glycerate kinase [Acidobacteriota bacterium]
MIAPDSIKGSLPAVSVAAAIAHGWRSQRPNDEIVQIPLADGGESSINTLHRVRGGLLLVIGLLLGCYWVVIGNDRSKT